MLIPPLLKRGDKIGIVSPSRMILESQVEKAMQIFREWGLDVVKGQNLFSQHGYFAGRDDQRREDLQRMLNDPSIKAIFCSRGGYGMTRIVDQLDLTAFRKYPKWVIGFSDITALHLHLHRHAICSIHGLMPVQYDYMGTEESLASLKKLLFEGEVNYEFPSQPMNQCGRAEGEMIGGNLSLVAESLGTPTEVDTTGKILFLEEIDEYLYKVDRMFMQLKRAGKLDNIQGLIVGDFSEMKDTQIQFGTDIYGLIADHFSDMQIPIVYNFPVGHEAYNLAMPCGKKVILEVTQTTTRLRG